MNGIGSRAQVDLAEAANDPQRIHAPTQDNDFHFSSTTFRADYRIDNPDNRRARKRNTDCRLSVTRTADRPDHERDRDNRAAASRSAKESSRSAAPGTIASAMIYCDRLW